MKGCPPLVPPNQSPGLGIALRSLFEQGGALGPVGASTEGRTNMPATARNREAGYAPIWIPQTPP
jgi:hypothetical protein